MLGGLPPGMHGLRDFDVRRGEHGMRRRDGMSFRWEGRVRERGWERLEELWGLGRREREQKGEC